jgi:hypothetical protein
VVADGGVAVAVGDQVPCQVVDRLGEQDGLLAEVQEYPVIVGVDVVEGQAADGCRVLGVEQDEEAGEPVFGLEGLVVQEAPGLVPAGFGVEGAGGAVPAGGGKSRRVCLRLRAQRTKCPVRPFWAVLAPAIQVSRSP